MFFMNASESRRANLRKILDDAIGQGLARNDADYCNKHDLNASYLSQMLNGHRPIGEKSARNIEAKLGLTVGFLDKPAEENDVIFHNSKLDKLINSLNKLDAENKLSPSVIDMLQSALTAVTSIQDNQEKLESGEAKKSA